jgi:tRNA threonylcarbamoyladenosine biosynthesis protein TsaB
VILSLDTTAEFGSIALSEEDQVIEEVLLHSPDGFGHVLYGRLQQLLDRHGARIDDIQCFAAASGPGSFTGVRVGLTAVKGLAFAGGKRVVPVSNLQALAWFGTARLRATVLDARRGEVYAAVYDHELNLVQAEQVIRFQDWLERLPEGEIELVSTDFAPFSSLVDARLPIVTAPRVLAGAIGRIAWKRFQAGQTCDPADVDANYVRRSDAELFWKD